MFKYVMLVHGLILTLTDDWSEIEEDFNNGECTILDKDDILDILER